MIGIKKKLKKVDLCNHFYEFRRCRGYFKEGCTLIIVLQIRIFDLDKELRWCIDSGEGFCGVFGEVIEKSNL